MHFLKSLLLFSCFLLPFLGQAQTTEYRDSTLVKVQDKSLAKYYEVITMTDSVAGNKKRYLLNGKLVSDANYAHVRKGLLSGTSRNWNEMTGKLKFEATYLLISNATTPYSVFDGTLKSYHPNGRLKREDLYRLGKVVKGKCFTQTGKDTAYYAYEILPQFPGGDDKLMKFIRKNTRYPKAALKEGVTGLVVVSFDVDKDGSLGNLQVLKGLSKELDQEAIRMISSMPPWVPGRLDGEKVKAQFLLPVRYSIR